MISTLRPVLSSYSELWFISRRMNFGGRRRKEVSKDTPPSYLSVTKFGYLEVIVRQHSENDGRDVAWAKVHQARPKTLSMKCEKQSEKKKG
jgi:hypothetical protein